MRSALLVNYIDLNTLSQMFNELKIRLNWGCKVKWVKKDKTNACFTTFYLHKIEILNRYFIYRLCFLGLIARLFFKNQTYWKNKRFEDYFIFMQMRLQLSFCFIHTGPDWSPWTKSSNRKIWRNTLYYVFKVNIVSFRRNSKFKHLKTYSICNKVFFRFLL